MHYFFHPNLLSDSILLNEEESRHCAKVLRKQVGDTIHLVDGKGMEANGVITDTHSKMVACKIESRIQHTLGRNYRLHLAIAPTKNTERMDWLIEKLTEIGVDQISFLSSERGERNRVNLDRLNRISISAMKQSKQFFLPELHPMTPLNEILDAREDGTQTYICWCETGTELHIKKNLKPNSPQNFLVLVGPEGDFTAAEVRKATDAGALPVSLGRNILRTETAALYAVCAIAVMDA